MVHGPRTASPGTPCQTAYSINDADKPPGTATVRWMGPGSPTRQVSGHTCDALLWLSHLKQKTHPKGDSTSGRQGGPRAKLFASLPSPLACGFIYPVAALWLLLPLFTPSESSLSRLPKWTEVLIQRLSRNHPGLRCQTGKLRHLASCLSSYWMSASPASRRPLLYSKLINFPLIHSHFNHSVP